MADRRWTIALALLASASALDAYAWYRTCSARPATGLHRMAWHRADGSLAPTNPRDVDPVARCEGTDIALSLAVWHGGLLVRCDDDKSVGNGWAFLDPATGQATLRWPSHGRDEFARALVPGPDHQLAILYGDLENDDLSVGIATYDGWARPPERLGHMHYDAAVWVGANLEIVVTELGDDPDSMFFDKPHSIITIGRGATTTRAVPALCAGPDCIEPELVYRAGGRWIFEGSGRATTERGDHVPAIFGRADMYGVDRVEQGTLAASSESSLGHQVPVLHADGTAGQSPPLPPGAVLDQLVDETRYQIDDRGIRRRPRWFIGTGFDVMMELVDGRSVFWSHDRDELLRVADSAAQLATARPVAYGSLSLEQRAFVPDGHEGYWLVDVSGEYIHLDHALERTDALPLRVHLRQRGSLGPFIDEPEHERELGWALFGLPVLLLGCACFGLSSRDGRLRWSMPRPLLAFAAGAYLVSGGLALHAVLPLLV